MVATRTLVQIAAWGGLIVSSTGFYLQQALVDKVRKYDYYRTALKKLRAHPGAIHYLGEPIKDKRFKLSDSENNSCDSTSAKFRIPVSGSKDSGAYYISAQNINDQWLIIKAELELKSKPDSRMNKMKFVGTSKEKFFYHNTLLCLVKAMEGKKITVDLRNDTYVCGTIESVDGFMNISFDNSVLCDTQGNEYFFEQLFVQGRNIRYVHIPENVSIVTAINEQLNENKRNVADKKPIKTSRKTTKALKQHMQVVASLPQSNN